MGPADRKWAGPRLLAPSPATMGPAWMRQRRWKRLRAPGADAPGPPATSSCARGKHRRGDTQGGARGVRGPSTRTQRRDVGGRSSNGRGRKLRMRGEIASQRDGRQCSLDQNVRTTLMTNNLKIVNLLSSVKNPGSYLEELSLCNLKDLDRTLPIKLLI